MGPQPPSLPHTDASRRARRSPFADRTKGVWCRLPPQLLSRSSYAWFWPSFHWKLRTHSATRFFAAPDTETRFPCLRTRSGPDIPGTTSKPKGTPRKYQSRSSPCATTHSEGMGIPGSPVWLGGGDYGSGIGKGDVDTRCDEDSPPRSATRNNTPTRLRFNHIAPNTRVRSLRAKRRSTLPWRCWTASLWLESSAGHHQL